MSIQGSINSMLASLSNKGLYKHLTDKIGDVEKKIPGTDNIVKAMKPITDALQGLKSANTPAEMQPLEPTTDYTLQQAADVEITEFADKSMSETELDDFQTYKQSRDVIEKAVQDINQKKEAEANFRTLLKQYGVEEGRKDLLKRIQEAKLKQAENRRKGYEGRRK